MDHLLLLSSSSSALSCLRFPPCTFLSHFHSSIPLLFSITNILGCPYSNNFYSLSKSQYRVPNCKKKTGNPILWTQYYYEIISCEIRSISDITYNASSFSGHLSPLFHIGIFKILLNFSVLFHSNPVGDNYFKFFLNHLFTCLVVFLDFICPIIASICEYIFGVDYFKNIH